METFRGSMLRPRVPLSTLRRRPHGRPRMTRGHRDRLGLRRTEPASATTCRSPGARRGFDDRSSPSASLAIREILSRRSADGRNGTECGPSGPLIRTADAGEKGHLGPFSVSPGALPLTQPNHSRFGTDAGRAQTQRVGARLKRCGFEERPLRRGRRGSKQLGAVRERRSELRGARARVAGVQRADPSMLPSPGTGERSGRARPHGPNCHARWSAPLGPDR